MRHLKRTAHYGLLFFLGMTLFSFTQDHLEKWVSKTGHVKFFSSTPAEDIESHNYKVTSTFDPGSGKMVYSVPMQAFEFDKRLMRKHFNKGKFLDTKTYPKAKYVGKITNLEAIDFSRDGSYTAQTSGKLSLHGETQPIEEDGTVEVKDGKVRFTSTFDLTLADYGVTFKRGKPAKNIAKTVEVTVENEFTK